MCDSDSTIFNCVVLGWFTYIISHDSNLLHSSIYTKSQWSIQLMLPLKAQSVTKNIAISSCQVIILWISELVSNMTALQLPEPQTSDPSVTIPTLSLTAPWRLDNLIINICTFLLAVYSTLQLQIIRCTRIIYFKETGLNV